MVKDYRERHSKKNGEAWVSYLKAGRVEMDERWPGSLFQTLEATEEEDLDFAIPVFRLGTHSDNEEEDDNIPIQYSNTIFQ